MVVAPRPCTWGRSRNARFTPVFTCTADRMVVRWFDPARQSTKPESGAPSPIACSARSTMRSTFYLVLPVVTLTASFPELRCLSKMTLGFRPPPDYGSGGLAMAVLADAAPCAPVPGRTCKRQWTVPLPAVHQAAAAVSACPCRSVRVPCRSVRVPLPQCPRAPAAVAGVRSAGHLRAASVRKPHPLSTPPDRRCPLAGADLARNPSRCPRTRTPRQCPRWVWACGRVLAGRPLSTADTAAAGGVRLTAELDTAAASAVGCCFRNAAGVRTASVHRGHCGQPGYRKRSPTRRPLEGCRHRR
jgi:hypothetical protein